MMNKKVFSVANNSLNCAVIEHDYRSLVLSFAEAVDTPYGIGARCHIRLVAWFKLNGFLYGTRQEADREARNIALATGQLLPIENKLRFECWTWSGKGYEAQRIKVLDAIEEANEWVFDCAELDFERSSEAPFIFDKKEHAEAWFYDYKGGAC
jgi:hypothetical protein